MFQTGVCAGARSVDWFTDLCFRQTWRLSGRDESQDMEMTVAACPASSFPPTALLTKLKHPSSFFSSRRSDPSCAGASAGARGDRRIVLIGMRIPQRLMLVCGSCDAGQSGVATLREAAPTFAVQPLGSSSNRLRPAPTASTSSLSAASTTRPGRLSLPSSTSDNLKIQTSNDVFYATVRSEHGMAKPSMTRRR